MENQLTDQEIVANYKNELKRKFEEKIMDEAVDEVMNSKETIDQVNLLIAEKRKKFEESITN